jgi:hypothetical protein
MFSQAHQSRSFKFVVVAAFMALEFSCTAADPPLRIALGQTLTEVVTTTADRGILRFDGVSGRVLMVNRAGTEDSNLDERDKLTLLPPGASESEGIPMSKDDQPGYWVGPLPKTGIYQLILRRSSNKPYRLRLTLMDAHDPRLDPGISPARVSIDTTLWGIKSTLSLQPFYPPIFAGVDDNWPAQLALVTKDLQVRIMSVEGIKKTLWEDDRWMQGLARLESALQPDGRIATPDLLPLAVYQDAALCFWGKQEIVEGKAWRGMRWIGFYAQDCTGGPVSDPMPVNYIFEAISRDGQYFMMIFADIAYLHPTPEWQSILDEEDEKSAKLINPLPVGRKRTQAVKAMEEEENRLLRQSVNLRLDQAQPSTFEPDLHQLDAAVHSLELR